MRNFILEISQSPLLTASGWSESCCARPREGHLGAKPSADKDFSGAIADAPTPASRLQMNQTGNKRHKTTAWGTPLDTRRHKRMFEWAHQLKLPCHKRDLGEPSRHRTSTWISLLPPGGHKRSSEWAHHLRLPCHKGTNGNQAVTGHQLGFVGGAATSHNLGEQRHQRWDNVRAFPKATQGPQGPSASQTERTERSGTGPRNEPTRRRPKRNEPGGGSGPDAKQRNEDEHQTTRTTGRRNTNEPQRNRRQTSKEQKKKMQHMT